MEKKPKPNAMTREVATVENMTRTRLDRDAESTTLQKNADAHDWFLGMDAFQTVSVMGYPQAKEGTFPPSAR